MEPTNKNYPPTIFLSVFPAKNKKNQNSPDFNVSVQINGKYENGGSGWKKTAVNGPYLSLSVDMEKLKQLIREKMGNMPEAPKLSEPDIQLDDPFNI